MIVERKPGPSYAALFLLVRIAFLTFAFTLAAHAGDPATITFSLDFPGSAPEHYTMTIETDGRAHYQSSGKVSLDSDAEDSYETDFQFSEATRARVFDLAAQAHYFSGKVDAGKKNLAFTGKKTLVYTSGQRHTSAEFNYSTMPAVQQLTALFQSVSGTLEYCRRLTYFHRYQKLALDDELKRMEDQAKRGEITELQAAKPVLQAIYDDQAVINMVRMRARRIAEMTSAGR
jgi:hypothetical protein